MARDVRGTTAIEYALIAAIISVGIIAALTTVGSQVKAMFASIVF